MKLMGELDGKIQQIILMDEWNFLDLRKGMAIAIIKLAVKLRYVILCNFLF